MSLSAARNLGKVFSQRVAYAGSLLYLCAFLSVPVPVPIPVPFPVPQPVPGKESLGRIVIGGAEPWKSLCS
jgi:hypothetical protein